MTALGFAVPGARGEGPGIDEGEGIPERLDPYAGEDAWRPRDDAEGLELDSGSRSRTQPPTKSKSNSEWRVFAREGSRGKPIAGRPVHPSAQKKGTP